MQKITGHDSEDSDVIMKMKKFYYLMMLGRLLNYILYK